MENTEKINVFVAPSERAELKAYVHTFGCQQNEADSEKIKGILKSLGYTIIDDGMTADVVIINTCAIRELAELKALSFIGQFKSVKQYNPDFILGVCGCMAAEPHVVEKIKSTYRHVSFTLEPGSIDKLADVLESAKEDKKRKFLFDIQDKTISEDIPVFRSNSFKAWVSIMYGCNNFCSYCIVPYVRGRERSRSSAQIIKECRELISQGYKEITLLGQNVNSYRSDMDFPTLLATIAEIDGDFILRFMTSHPKDASDELIEVIARHRGKIAPHFHLPLQSGSDAILKKMNRSYNMERYLGIISKLRDKIPGVAITSDIIVGFPGESEDDFELTMEALRRVKFDMVYSFIYSSRKGTKAAEMPDQLSKEIKSERMNRLLKLQDEIAIEKNTPYLNKTVRVLVDSCVKNDGEITYSARTDSNKLVHFHAEDGLVGHFADVEITRIAPYNMFANLK